MCINYEYPEGSAKVSWWEETIYCSLVQTRHGHWCGYARFPKQPTQESGYSGILTYVPVHGGITYARQDDDGTMVYGFDCAHADDDNNPLLQDLDWLKAECQRMVAAILAAASVESLYLDAKDNPAKADVIDRYHAACQEHGIEFNLQDNFGAMINIMFGGEL